MTAGVSSSGERAAPDDVRGGGGAVVRQAALAQGSIGFAITGLGACLVLLAQDLQVRPEQLAWLPTTFGAGLLAVAPIGPSLLRRGSRPALVGGALLIAAGAILLATATTVPVAAAGALLLGVGGAAFVLVTPAMLAGPSAAGRLTTVIGLSSAASVVAPLAIGGWDTTGIGTGRLALLLVVPPLAMLIADACRRPVPLPPAAGTSPASAVSWPVARRWAVVVLAVSVEFCFTIWGVARLTGAGASTGAAALLGTAFPFGMACGRLAGPWLLSRLPVVVTGALVTGVSTLAVVVAGSPALVAAGLAGAGLGVATLYPVTLARLVATPGLSRAHAASVGAFASGTAIVAAPAALARLADVADLRLAYLVTLPLLAAMLLLHRRD
ncbi:MFS transporter [Actinoplanes sp. RD1]|uniref:MFS transporter n=1 Tax=Actinoplanes sp. RD1 TaxID=3064538 RepID=UPI0027403F1B|nr:hypothetical protein [Actinoplanes sp. RD1]